MADPIHQFQIVNLFTVAKLGNTEIAFTNSAAFMFATVALVSGFLIATTGERALVPGRLQSLSEMTYEFVAGMLRDGAGEAGMKFFPLVFSLFIFVLTANLFGMIPFAFTVTSHIIVTFALAMLVFLTVTIYGFVRHGTHFLRVFVPSGVPIYVLPLVVLIELISFLSRPISHSVRLFANMLAGHITLKVFAGFVGGLLGAGAALAPLAVLPLAMVVALTALEFLIAFMQAYVFAILTCLYLNDALHPGH
jgi:F-type H+-transporting ATPase subunit a